MTYWKARKKADYLGIDLANLSGYAMYLHEKFGFTTLKLSKDKIKEELKQAWKNLRSVQKEDRAHRKQFLEELAEERAKQQNIAVSSAIKQINNAEESKQSHKKFNNHLRPKVNGAIDHVMIPIGDDPNGVFGKKWKKITEEEEVEKLLLEQNQNKLRELKYLPLRYHQEHHLVRI